MNNLLTVIIQTSPIPSHPSTALLSALFRSFSRVDGIRHCRILIVADGCDEVAEGENEGLKRGKVSTDSARRYREHLRRLENEIGQAPFHGLSVELIKLPERFGSARAIEHIMTTQVATPFVMICQHDNFFVDNVSLHDVLSAMTHNPWIKALHFPATATMNYGNKVQKRYGIDLVPRHVAQLEYPLIPLVFWFGRTHVARTDYYRDFVLKRSIETGQHLEELLGELQLNDIRKNGMIVHDLYGNFVMDQGEEVLYHLSGRRARAVQEAHQGDADSGSGNLDSHQREQQQTCGDATVGDETIQDHPVWVEPTTDSNSDDIGSTSFTNARSCRAIVPGLELAPPSRPPRGKFRQKCFHCGEKGHSYRFCPHVSADEQPKTHVIDLS